VRSPGTNANAAHYQSTVKSAFPRKNMHKLIFLSAAALLAGALAGGAQATPLSATGAMAMSGVADQAMPDQGVIKARWHQRHYRWSRGYHYGWRPHYSRRYANYRGFR